MISADPLVAGTAAEPALLRSADDPSQLWLPLFDPRWKEAYVSLFKQWRNEDVPTQLALALKITNAPTRLFKYRRWNDHTIDILRQNVLWLTSPLRFNDPFDCWLSIVLEKMHNWIFETCWEYALDSADWKFGRVTTRDTTRILNFAARENIRAQRMPHIALVKAILAKHAQQGVQYIDYIHWYVRNNANDTWMVSILASVRRARDRLRLTCFSEVCDSILMWSHYAGQHTGVVIEYSTNEILAHDAVLRDSLHPVVYTDGVDDANRMFTHVIDPINPFLTTYCACRKAADWSYEREWRLVLAAKHLDDPISVSMPKPRGVIIGAAMQPTEEQQVRNLCDSLSIPVRVASMSTDRFALETRRQPTPRARSVARYSGLNVHVDSEEYRY